jgi:hypothetical protein
MAHARSSTGDDPLAGATDSDEPSFTGVFATAQF